MIDGKQDTVVHPAGYADVNRRFSAVAADLKTGPQSAGFEGNIIQTAPLVFFKETLGCGYQLWINVHGQALAARFWLLATCNPKSGTRCFRDKAQLGNYRGRGRERLR